MTYFLKDNITLTAKQEALLDNAIERLKKQEPIQYILGYSDFCGLRFKVTQATLIPRPETSELVEWIASEATGKASILDIGTGSGCIAISLANKMPQSKVTAWDISPDALAVATENSKANGCAVEFEEIDILAYKPTGELFDIIVSNPPYIKENEAEAMHANVLHWEPHTALFVPDSDPLLFYRTIAQKGLAMLYPGGRLYFEINRAHGKDTMVMLESLGYTDIELRKDFAENDRMIRAVKPKGKSESSCQRVGGNLFTHAMTTRTSVVCDNGKIRANESRGQIYLHYAECSRIWMKSTLAPQRSATKSPQSRGSSTQSVVKSEN